MNKKCLIAVIFVAMQMIVFLSFGRMLDDKLKNASAYGFVISSVQHGEDINGRHLLITIEGEDEFYTNEGSIYGIIKPNHDREYYVDRFLKDKNKKGKDDIYLKVERENRYGAIFNLKYYDDRDELNKIYNDIELDGKKAIAIIKVKDGYGKVANIKIK